MGRAKKSVVDSSGQTWKLRAGFALMMFGFAVLIYGVNNLDRFFGLQMLCLGVVLGLGAALITCLAVHCPRCSARWLWIAASERSSASFLQWLAVQEACPRCGYPGTANEQELRLQGNSDVVASDDIVTRRQSS